MHYPFDYNQKVLVAVEVSKAGPTSLPINMATYRIFERIPQTQMEATFREKVPFLIRWLVQDKFNKVLEKRVGYWEKRLAPEQKIYVHYALGDKETINQAMQVAKKHLLQYMLIGVYHFEPQACAYPFAFPTGDVPNPWVLGHISSYSNQSIFWFNFFPAQAYLFNKIYRTWLHFNMINLKESGECNQLVTLDDNQLITNCDTFLTVNLNRFTNMKGYINSARIAGKKTFVGDDVFTWYGMLLKMIV